MFSRTLHADFETVLYSFSGKPIPGKQSIAGGTERSRSRKRSKSLLRRRCDIETALLTVGTPNGVGSFELAATPKSGD